MKSKSLKALVALGAATFFASNAWAVDSSRLRLLLGISGTVTEYNQTDSSGNTSDLTNVTGWDTETSGAELSYIFDNGIGLGLSSGTVKITQKLTTSEIAVSGGGFDLSYTVGEDVNLTLGMTLFGDASLSTYQINGTDYAALYKSTSKRNQSYFVNLGFSIGENWELVVGQRSLDVEVETSDIITGTVGDTYDAKFTVTSIGAGYRFK